MNDNLNYQNNLFKTNSSYFKPYGNIKFDNNSNIFSLTQKDTSVSSLAYSDSIDVSNFNIINISLSIKAKKISNLFYCVELFDRNKNPISTLCKNVTDYISNNFREIILRIPIDEETFYIKIRFDFIDTVIACKLLNPRIFTN